MRVQRCVGPGFEAKQAVQEQAASEQSVLPRAPAEARDEQHEQHKTAEKEIDGDKVQVFSSPYVYLPGNWAFQQGVFYIFSVAEFRGNRAAFIRSSIFHFLLSLDFTFSYGVQLGNGSCHSNVASTSHIVSRYEPTISSFKARELLQ